jgi:hypothetical protein
MRILVRAVFFASLAVVLPQLELSRAAGPAAGAAGAVAEPVQIHQAPHPASYGPRSCVPDGVTDHLAHGLAVPAQPTHGRSRLAALSAPETEWFGAATAALALLPLSRAPPALS